MKLLLIMMVLASVTMADDAVTDKVFFSGIHLGMTIEAAWSYYFPDGAVPAAVGAPALGSIPLGGGNTAAAPKAIADAGAISHSGAPKGEKELDFRTNSNPQDPRRVLVDYRESDGVIVYVCYWHLAGNKNAFSPEEQRYLTDLNSGQGPLKTTVDDDGEFEVTTVAQYKVEHPKELRAVDSKTFFRGARLGMTIDEAKIYYDKIAETGTVNSGIPIGEGYLDFHTLSDPERFITVYFRKSDRKIVSVLYQKMGKNETFSPEERDAPYTGTDRLHLYSLHRTGGAMLRQRRCSLEPGRMTALVKLTYSSRTESG